MNRRDVRRQLTGWALAYAVSPTWRERARCIDRARAVARGNVSMLEWSALATSLRQQHQLGVLGTSLPIPHVRELENAITGNLAYLRAWHIWWTSPGVDPLKARFVADVATEACAELAAAEACLELELADLPGVFS